MAPGIVQALISAGGPLLSGLFSGIGSGISGANNAKVQREMLAYQKEKDAKDFEYNKYRDNRSFGFQGLNALLDIQKSAMANSRGKIFRDLVTQG